MALPAFRVARTRTDTGATIRHHAPASGETFSAGDVVRIIVDNTIKEAVTDEAAAYGIALGDAVVDGTLQATVPVACFDGNVEFSGANTGTAYVEATHAGDEAALEVNTGVHGVDVGNAAGNDLFEIVGADTTDSGRVIVTVPAAKSQFPGFGTAAYDAS